MSAFIASEKTFSDIFSGLKMYASKTSLNDSVIGYAIENALEGKSPEEFIDVLFRLNVRAVNQRYGDATEESHTKTQLMKKCALNAHISRQQFLKSLECVHYQMSEGDVPQTKMFKMVELLIQSICKAIAHSSTEYDNAHWD